MHLHFERVEKPSSYCDCNIRTLSWMGKVPDGPLQKEEEGWKLNRSQYYSDGWLATGNVRGIVGCTFTTCSCRKIPLSDLPNRTNYNLRGHRAEVTIVKWNEPYQKLATCDSSGIIFVWIKYEGRWSIELINDRNTPVTDFSWSHDGRMALICYTDGFVLVGSVTGQRYWSSMLNLDSCHTTCGIWTPDDQHVFFGTSKGHIIVIQVNGTVVSQVTIRDGVSIASMSWSCEKFKMEDTDEQSNDARKSQEYVLAVCFTDGVIYLMKNYDDIFPTVIASRLESVKMEWSNNGDVLAVAGHKRKTTMMNMTTQASAVNDPLDMHQTRQSLLSGSGGSSGTEAACKSNQQIPGTTTTTTLFINSINFYTAAGILRFRVNINFLLHPVTALTWGHNDKRIFVATGAVLHIAWISKKVPSLQLLSRLTVFRLLPNESSSDQLKLPSRIQALISSLFTRTLRCYLPQVNHLREFVSKPPIGNVRLHCTLIRHDDDLIGGCTTYVLYLEYLGGLVPILKGKRASKLKPEFVIFDPQSELEKRLPGKSERGASSSCQSAPQSRSTTPILSRRKAAQHCSSNQLYWNSHSVPASGTESESDDNGCMTDGYGHVYSLPSPMMRRKCRRKRRGAAQPDSDPVTGMNHAAAAAAAAAAEQPAVEEIAAAAAAAAGINNGNNAGNNRRNSGNNNAEGNTGRTPEVASTEVLKPESTYMDEMPESERLILVTSNIWGTKFKILGLSARLPSCLGTISYRTSVLHLQPRQMTLQIKELGSRRRSSTRSDLKICSPADEIRTFEHEVHVDRPAIGSPVDFSDNYAPIAPMTPRKNIRSHRRSVSPDRKRIVCHLRSNESRNQNHDEEEGLISALNEEILTLQLNGESNHVTMEMELHQRIPSSISGFHSMSQSHFPSHHHHGSHPALLPASSRTSLHEFNKNDHYLPYLQYVSQANMDRNQSPFSPTEDHRPDDLIAQMARQLAAEYTLTQLTSQSDGSDRPHQQAITAAFPHRQIAAPNHPLAPNDNHSFSPDFASCTSISASPSHATAMTILSPKLDSYSPLARQIQQQHVLFDGKNVHDQHLFLQSEHQREPTFSHPLSSSSVTNMGNAVYRQNSCETEGEYCRRRLRSMMPDNRNNCSSAAALSAADLLTPGLQDDVCDVRDASISRSPGTGRCMNPNAADSMKGHLRQRSLRQQQLEQHINQQLQPVLVPSLSRVQMPSSPAALAPQNPSAHVFGGSSNALHVVASSSRTRTDEESAFSVVRDPLMYSCPPEMRKYTDRMNGADDGIILPGQSSDVYSFHQSTSLLIPSSDSMLLSCMTSSSSAAAAGAECEPLISSCQTNTIDGSINPGTSSMDRNNIYHNDFLNVRTRSGSTPSAEVPRLTLRPLCRKSMGKSGVPFERAIELLHQTKADSGSSKFNCTELDGIDACPMDESLSCECENDCSQPSVDSVTNVLSEKSGFSHYEYAPSERTAYRSESSYNGSCNLINNSNIFSTPVHRPNRNRFTDYNKYENLISRDSVIAVTAVPSSRMHGDVQLSPSIIEIIPDSDRMDRRQLHKQQHLQLQLHHPSSDLRPSPGFTSDAEIMPPMAGMSFRSGLLRSSSATNSSSSTDAPIRSLPASPSQRRRAFGRSILNSPLVLRKVLKQKLNHLDCSSEDEVAEDAESESASRDFLDSFRRSRISGKMLPKTKGKPRRGSRVQPENEGPKFQEEIFREFILQNKAPFWNELSQVYQLDFGGRVTQESAKNFQIEHQANQVMQFGRIDGNAYTLDFQYPFSALQALAVALANVTQRLK